MALIINKGRRVTPVRAVIYGPEGIGKSSLAAAFPNPLFLDVEDGTAQLDVSSVPCANWDALLAAIKTLAGNPHGAQTIVIDSADWAEKALIEHVLRQSGKSSIEDFGYGKGYTVLCEHWMRFLGLCDGLSAAGLNVVFTAHSLVKRMSPPDQTDGYDRYELKLSKQVAPLLKEWSDILLFCNFRVLVVEGTDGKLKAQGGRERVMYATHSAAWDAKNRYGLPDEMPMAFASLAPVFAGKQTSGSAAALPCGPTATAPAAERAASVAPAAEPVRLADDNQVAQLNAYAKTEIGGPIIERALTKANAIEVAELTEDQAAKTIAFLLEKFAQAHAEKQAAPAPALPAASAQTEQPLCMPTGLAAWLLANEATVNAYLVRVKWVQAGQTFRDLPVDKVAKIDDRREQFARAAGIAVERKAA